MIRALSLTISTLALAMLPASAIAQDQIIRVGNLLADAGLTPREAIASATTIAAKTLDMDNEIGRIAVGYSADLIALDGNPLDDVRRLEKVDWVMVRGRIID